MNDGAQRPEDTGAMSRDKYNFIVGLLAALLAFSAFQGTLTRKLDFGFFEASMLQLMGAFGVIIGLSAYMFAWYFAKMNTRYENAAHLRFLKPAADALYVAALAFPLLMMLVWLLSQGVTRVIDMLSQMPLAQRQEYIGFVTAALGSLVGILALVFIIRYTKHRAEVSRQVDVIDLRQRSMNSIESAQQLYTKGNYAATIMEAYKAVILVLRAVLLFKDVPLASYERSYDIMSKARYAGVITKDDMKVLDKMRRVRNKAAHLDISLTQKQADDVLKNASAVLEKISSQIE
jgi:uncharacterized protein (UPF0332 family)